VIVNIIDQVKVNMWRLCRVGKASVFYPLDIEQDWVRVDLQDKDILNNSLTRKQLWFIDLLETDEIFCPQICKSKYIATMEAKYRERFKKLLLEKSLGTRDIDYLLGTLEFTFFNGVLGYDCK